MNREEVDKRKLEDDCQCGCGHNEEVHHHEHEEECCCGHEHHDEGAHHHEHEEEHHHHKPEEELKCNKCGKNLDECNCDLEEGKYKKEIFILENLGCANCAAKMETKIKNLPEVRSATITFTTKQLRVTGENPKELLAKFQEICSSIESEVVVKIRDEKQNAIEQKGEENQEKKELFGILLGAVVFGAGLLIKENFGMASIISMAISYLILGGEIVVTAVKNLFKGKVFDENFLMTIATLGAFGIQEYPEAVGVMLFYRIGEFFEHKAVAKSRSQIMQTIDMRAENVTLVTGDNTKVIPAIEAKVGDIILIKPGERIPLDGVIVEGETRIDTSPVTGEPVPVGAKVKDSVISGCVNVSGVVKMKVEKVLEESMVSRIMESVENAAASKPKIDRFITKFARVYTPFVVIVALATAIIPSLIIGNWERWVYTALTFLVISCPCALVLSVPLSFFSGIGAGSKKGILFKGGLSLEAMKDVKAVVMDKTGTITEGNFLLQKAVPMKNTTETELLSIACACEANSTHPIAVSIVSAAKEKKVPEKKASKVTEITGHGIEAVIEGKKVLCGNRKLMDLKGIDCKAYENKNYGTEVLVATEGKFIGYLVISDTIKKDAKSAIHSMNKQGIVTVMLTGDTEENAKAVAEETGVNKVYAKLLPEDKVNKLQEIRKEYGNVMFVGDGINDAPVLAGADVGAAMGSGADAAIEAADVVFMTSSMEAVPESLKIAKVTGRIAMENVVFALVVKALVMILGLAGIASMWLAVFADSGVAMICVLNSIRVLYRSH
ncbi:MAG: cadmium-translocating P-type ATPase [Lachnospiraceae bacterium]|nr:cadmium-translocating P-type ATPase [Lachnospiraceae bacterium]